jgi:hypothetical protein
MNIFFIKKLYKSIIPLFIRVLVWNFFNERRFEILKKQIIKYFDSEFSGGDLFKEELNYLRENKISVFPYFDINNSKIECQVFEDNLCGLKYVMFEGEKMYFKRGMSSNQIEYYFKEIIKEQHINSPHRYLIDEFDVIQNDIVFDIGVAEGNFALSVINRVSLIYLFEPDLEWVEALSYTFNKWHDKVKIIPKLVSKKSTDSTISLDEFIKKENIHVDFIKIDVEGEEFKLLSGMKTLLNSNSLKRVAICAYHNQEDEMVLSEELLKFNYQVTTSDRVMLFIYDENIYPPFFRKGVIRATLLNQNSSNSIL